MLYIQCKDSFGYAWLVQRSPSMHIVQKVFKFGHSYNVFFLLSVLQHCRLAPKFLRFDSDSLPSSLLLECSHSRRFVTCIVPSVISCFCLTSRVSRLSGVMGDYVAVPFLLTVHYDALLFR